ncbi:hypothetical protein [Staphylococcus gallinarum]|uniref:hypothetical protein n=1 Tax=Staphylococcus gallinarum TaxID=1293 RepID=UPI001E404AB6|nr:hypothetical protein [Staphylococcus gallinarum]MCD8845175.1 hypothetical protein [Staphylococcus gallinarum]
MSRIKVNYKIPPSINLSRWDIPISLKKGSIGPGKPVTYLVIVTATATFLLWMFIFSYMLKNHFGILAPIGFTIGFIMFCTISLKRGPTGEMGFHWFKPLYKYWMRYKDRFIQTRGIANSSEVDKLKWQIPIESIDEETGMIEYVNGDLGAMFTIIGNGSRALFVDEKEKIISAFENVLQQIDLGVSITIESKQSRQDCSEQIKNLENLKNKNTNPEIDQILSSKIDIMKNDIETKFKSTHQYLYLRAKDEDRLNTAINILLRQRGEGLFRYMEVLKGEKQKDRLSEFFRLS